MGHGFAAAVAHRHFFPGVGMPVDRRVDGAVQAVGHAPHERQIAALHFVGAAMIGELRGQRFVGAVVLGATISPVVSLSSRCTMPGRLTPPMPDRLAPQWAIRALTSVPVSWPAAGCTTRPFGLVDDDDVVILEHDIERDIFARGLGGDRFRHVDCDRIALLDMISGVAEGGAPGGDGTGQDQRLQPRARQLRPADREHAVEPDRALVAGDDDLKPLSAIRRLTLFQ